MKHKGSGMEYAEERARDLMRARDECMASMRRVRMPEVYARVVAMPSRRFWVTGMRASQVISRMGREGAADDMRPLKREMFMEIRRRVEELRKRMPGLTLAEYCERAVESPAPKFYLTPGSAKVIICKARKKWKEEKLKRLRLSRWRP